MKAKILVVEDDKNLRQLVVSFGQNQGYEMLEAANGIEALKKLAEHPEIMCVVLDVMMPGLDGFETIKFIRETNQVPIIFLTARDQFEDELKGFDLGANDYVTKPFKPQLLMARINAQLKSNLEEKLNFAYRGLILDDRAHELTINENVIELSPKEYELLGFLVNNINIALSREQLLDGVWGMDYFGGLRTVDTHVKRLRLKITPYSDLIKTIRGVGYKFEAV